MRLPQIKSLLLEVTGNVLNGQEISIILDVFADVTSGDWGVDKALAGGIEDVEDLRNVLLRRFGLQPSISQDDTEWKRRLQRAELDPNELTQVDRANIATVISSLHAWGKLDLPGQPSKKWKDDHTPERKQLMKSVLRKIGFGGVAQEIDREGTASISKKPIPGASIKLPKDKESEVPRKAGGWESETDPWGHGRVGSEDALEFLDKYGEALEKAGVEISGQPKVLGGDRGAQGTPVDIGGTVLKFTTDRTEANASYRIKGKKLKNVANIYNVFELDSEHVYVIHQELLDPLDKDVKIGWSYLKFRKIINNYFRNKDKNKALEDFSEEAQYEYGDLNMPIVEKMHKVLEQALNAADELMAHKIIAPDRHDDNVMQRMDGTIVLIDLGLSRSPEVKVPHVDV
jgi:hypothetical protein